MRRAFKREGKTGMKDWSIWTFSVRRRPATARFRARHPGGKQSGHIEVPMIFSLLQIERW